MNKEELLKLVNNLNIPKSEYYILGGGSLVLFGIKETTSDLDLCVSQELFEKLKDRYNLNEEKKNECGFYKISNTIEIIPNSRAEFIMDTIDEYNVEKLEKILEFKKKRNALKDKEAIKKIVEYIKNNK